MTKLFLCAAAALCLACVCRAATAPLKPTSTHKFAQGDTSDFYLDIYLPAEGSQTTVDGKTKPAVLFMFGGGFKTGMRNADYYNVWFKQLTDMGYPVVSIDYRLGLKDSQNAGFNKAFIDDLDAAIGMAVDDLFTATNWLIDNGGKYGIDADNIVISGSSAGAISVLQAEWEICNGTQRAGVLPVDFNYKGVISYSGAIFSRNWGIKFPSEPCPMMLLHGTADKIVEYKQMAFFNLRWVGSSQIVKALAARNANYRIYRFKDRKHEIANSMEYTTDLLDDFIQKNIMKGSPVIVDATVDNPSIPVPDWGQGGFKDLY